MTIATVATVPRSATAITWAVSSVFAGAAAIIAMIRPLRWLPAARRRVGLQRNVRTSTSRAAVIGPFGHTEGTRSTIAFRGHARVRSPVTMEG